MPPNDEARDGVPGREMASDQHRSPLQDRTLELARDLQMIANLSGEGQRGRYRLAAKALRRLIQS